MVYVPPDAVISVPAGLPAVVPVQLTLYPAVPPDAVIVPTPLAPPLHVTFVTALLTVIAMGWVIVTVVVAAHPLASVTVTVYVPAANPVAVCVVCPVAYRPTLIYGATDKLRKRPQG